MPTRKNPVTLEATGSICGRRGARPAAFIARRARAGLHRGWVQAPETPAASPRTSRAIARPVPRRDNVGFLVVRNDDDAIVGVFNFSEIVRGAFHSATSATTRSRRTPATATWQRVSRSRSILRFAG